MKVLIIEDEISSSNYLKKTLASIDSDIIVVDVCMTVSSSVKWLKNNSIPDIIFMDIELTDGKSFEIFEQVNITSPVIFITAYDDFAIKAIKLNVLDYLLKPIDDEELANALLRVKKHSGLQLDYSQLNQAYVKNASGQGPKKLAIYDMKGARFVDIDKIIRLKADSNYTNIYLSMGESILSSRTLKSYDDILKGFHFFRISNTYIVNMAHIERYVKGIEGTIIMTDGETLEVSRTKKKEFLEALSLNHY